MLRHGMDDLPLCDVLLAHKGLLIVARRSPSYPFRLHDTIHATQRHTMRLPKP
jgi:hypothetical protein